MKTYDQTDRLTRSERSVIIGSLLGDANVIRGVWKGKPSNARIRFVQGHEQIEYLQWKYVQLKRWITTPINPHPVKTEFGGQIHRLNTVTHPLFTEIYHLLYPHGEKQKRITPQLLTEIDDLALAVWYMDDGSGSRHEARIATYAFQYGDLQLAAETLCERGIDARVMSTSKGDVLNFSATGTKALYDKVEPHIPLSMRYKIGEVVTLICVVCHDRFQIRKVGADRLPQTCGASCQMRLAHQNRRSERKD